MKIKEVSYAVDLKRSINFQSAGVSIKMAADVQEDETVEEAYEELKSYVDKVAEEALQQQVDEL